MNDAILMLRLEHQKMAEVLAIFAREREALKVGSPPDIDLLESGLDYLVGYSDQCHHPKEELIYHKLLARDEAVTSSLINLEKEHSELRRLTNELAATVDICRLPDESKSQRLSIALDQYLDYYRHHMQMEEKHLFRLAPQVLTESDWGEIEFSLFDKQDPLFNQQTEERYTNLRKALKQLDSDHREQISKVAREDFLAKDMQHIASLATLADFNSSPEVTREHCRLERVGRDGYRLLHTNGSSMIDIPQCAEQQAVWIACYFLKGRESVDQPVG